jgi:ATP-dependent helicase/DNAse subunit B
MEVSYTMLKSFMDCEYSYYLRYIKRIPIVESSASVYGSAIHRTIKQGYENNLDKDDWVKLFKVEWLMVS